MRARAGRMWTDQRARGAAARPAREGAPRGTGVRHDGAAHGSAITGPPRRAHTAAHGGVAARSGAWECGGAVRRRIPVEFHSDCYCFTAIYFETSN
jgi:hypothetical protein